MEFDQIPRRAWFSGGLIALLGLLGLIMAVLQYRWTGDLSRAEQSRLKDALQLSLHRISQDLDTEVITAIRALQPTPAEIAAQGKEPAYGARFARWRAQNPEAKLFAAVGLAIPAGTQVELKQLNFSALTFAPAEWPTNWSGLRGQLNSRLRGERPPPGTPNSFLIEMPRFGPATGAGQNTPANGPGAFVEQEWLVLELNAAHLRDVVLPRQIAAHLSTGGGEPYQVEVYADAAKPFFRSGLTDRDPPLRGRAQASTQIFEGVRPNITRMLGGPLGSRFGPGSGPGRSRFDRDGRRDRRPWDRGTSDKAQDKGPPDKGFRSEPSRAGWEIFVSPPGGSLEALVERTRWRNLALALSLIMLIIATSLLLVRSARQAQQLAELQMNFVSSVSHELRTPLTVIRTAAFNLRGPVAAKPEQVERYVKLIQEQSERLGSLVEQVLRYASSRVGQMIQEKEAVVIDDVIEGGIQASQLALDNSPYQLDKKIDPGLPLVLADERALQHVIQNLLDNAVKYGTETSNWIGLTAIRAGDFLEICVADCGPGIPADEQALVFEPFFRGRRALADQVQGTGLGLNLVKKIVEAHGGSIRVQNHSPRGSEFVVRVPVAPPEMQDEFAHTAG